MVNNNGDDEDVVDFDRNEDEEVILFEIYIDIVKVEIFIWNFFIYFIGYVRYLFNIVSVVSVRKMKWNFKNLF